MWQDRKFLWLVASVAVVAVSEFLSLTGRQLPREIAAPFFAAIILAVGWRTIWNGLKALSKLNFWSINLVSSNYNRRVVGERINHHGRTAAER